MLTVKRSKIRKNGIGRIPWYAKGAAQHLGLHICPKKRVKLGTGGLSMSDYISPRKYEYEMEEKR
jgi:hypothetical protein